MAMLLEESTFVSQRVANNSAYAHEAGIISSPSSIPAIQTKRQSGLPLWLSNGVPMHVETTAGRALQLSLKRVMDVTIALLALLFLAPLLVLVAIAVKLSSPGPVLFGQIREGLDGTTFRALKFRSMRTELGDVTGVKQTLHDDPRVTPLGRFIRKTSIDELPQLLNVLRGDMSIVGPRPHVPGMLACGMRYDVLVPYYAERLRMRPGITGWAQSNGLRGLTDTEQAARARVDHDLAYIQNFSLLLDLRIIVQTAVREFVTGSGH